MSVRLNKIIQLQSFAFRFPFAIHIDDIINDLQRVTWCANTSLDIVLASIYGPRDNVAEDIFALTDECLAIGVTQCVIVRILHAGAHRIAGREVEDHDIAFLRTRPSC